MLKIMSKPLMSLRTQAIQRVPPNAESDFTACGSDTSNNSPCHYQDVSPDTVPGIFIALRIVSAAAANRYPPELQAPEGDPQ